MNKILEIRNLSKSYGRRGYQTWVLRDISLDIFQGDFIGIMGPSGAGKTTLLNMLSTLDKPSRGEILLEGENIVEMKNKELSLVRRDKIGFIFQDYNLLDNMTLQDNIALPLSLNGVKTGEILVALVTTTQTEWAAGQNGCAAAETEGQVLEGWKELIQALPLEGKLAGILHVKNDSLADVVQSDETEILYGQDYFYEELLGLRFKISPFSFFQTNSLGAEVLYSKVRDYIGDTAGQVVFDLYSGTGTIAQILAPVAEKVVGVEIVEEAVKAARENAARNGLSNCEFIAGDVLKVVGDLKDKPDLIVLDPPRDGVHPKALNQIIDFGVKRMVYVSCKPTSLQRDLVTLQERGYRMVRACCVDMFPGTGNCEVVALLTR